MVFGELDGAELATGIVLRHVPMPQTPDTIGNARFHRWGTRKTLMYPIQITDLIEVNR